MRFPTMDEMAKAMADPVGYVEAHGGIAGFLQTPLSPTNDPVPPVSRLTPSPLTSPLTPVPGATATPTTLGGAAGAAPAGGGKKPLGCAVCCRHHERYVQVDPAAAKVIGANG